MTQHNYNPADFPPGLVGIPATMKPCIQRFKFDPTTFDDHGVRVDRAREEILTRLLRQCLLSSPEWRAVSRERERLFMLQEKATCWGDSIQQARMVPYLAPHFPGAALVVRRELVRLFSPLGLRVVAFDDVDREERGRVSSFFLPPGVRIPRSDEWALPTLWADESVPFNPDRSRLHVGLCWHGSGGGRSAPGLDDDWRCIRPEMLAPLLSVPGVEFTALHFNDHGRALPALTNLSELGVWDFAGTAGVIKRLDLVITIDTSVAHLAGNLDIPTWLMLVSPKHSGFDAGRWNRVPPLYPSVRQFRQEIPDDWSAVVALVRAELASAAQEMAPYRSLELVR